MRFGKPKVCEALELLKNALTRGRIDPPFLHSSHEVPLEGLHAFWAALGPHRATQLIGARTRQTCGIRRNAHELLLKEWNAERVPQRWLEERVQIGNLLAS